MTPLETNDPLADEPMELMEWLQTNRTWLAVAAAVVVIGGGGWWVFRQSRLTKEVNANKALMQAKQSLDPSNPNPTLAQNDLQKLVSRYSGTGAGSEGAMLLAQLDYDQSKYQEGVMVLESAAKSAPQPLESQLRSLIGDGYMSMKNPIGAAKEYEQAADLTDGVMDRATQRARAARAYMMGGDSTKARQLWTDLSKDTKNQAVAAEAKVRLGEIEAKVARKG